MNRHFTSEEFLQWIAGERTAERDAHLQSCADCAAELEHIQEPLALFRGAVRDWSAKERTNLAAEKATGWAEDAERIHHSPLWVRFATAGAALALAVALGIAANDWRQAVRERAAQSAAQEDEALLGNIQAKVMRPVPATMQPVYNLMAQSYGRSEDAK